MTYTVENSLFNFQFWGGAKQVVARLSPDELETIEDVLEEVLGGSDEIPTETQINDIFWFDTEWILEIIGTDESEDEFYEREIQMPKFLKD